VKDENHDWSFFNVEGFRKYVVHGIGIESLAVTAGHCCRSRKGGGNPLCLCLVYVCVWVEYTSL
jgi:hypothetical protein